MCKYTEKYVPMKGTQIAFITERLRRLENAQRSQQELVSVFGSYMKYTVSLLDA